MAKTICNKAYKGKCPSCAKGLLRLYTDGRQTTKVVSCPLGCGAVILCRAPKRDSLRFKLERGTGQEGWDKIIDLVEDSPVAQTHPSLSNQILHQLNA